jgi:hypothetical protein
MRRHTPHRNDLLFAALLVLVLAGAFFLVLFRHNILNASSTSAVIQGSGVAASQTRELAAFSSVELTGSNDVSIQVGRTQRVVVYADDNLLSRVTTHVQKGRLLIGNAPGSFATKAPMRVEVRVRSLNALAMSGNGVVEASGVSASRLTVTLEGSGLLRAGGKAARLDVAVSGSGDVQLQDLVAAEVHALVSGSGRIIVTATHALDASVPGSGAIVYLGNPRDVRTTVTGSGAVTPG